MFKTALSVALVGLASAQSLASLQPLANQAIAAAQPVLDSNNNQYPTLTQTPDATSLSYGEYEWSVTEHNNEYGFDTNTGATGTNSLAPALSALLANVGTVAQQNSEEVQNILDAEAPNAGVDVTPENGNSNVASVVNSYGQQLQDNADTLANAAQTKYDQAFRVANANSNVVNNNQAVTSNTVGDAVNTAVNAATPANVADAANAINTSGSPLQVQVQQPNTAAVTNAANNVAGSVSPNQAADTVNNLAGQGANAVPKNAANTAQDSVNAAANSLNANGINNVNQATASLPNGL